MDPAALGFQNFGGPGTDQLSPRLACCLRRNWQLLCPPEESKASWWLLDYDRRPLRADPVRFWES